MIQIDLPWPPSQNSIWRGSGSRVYRSQKYMTWIKEAAWLIKLAKLKKIEGQFSATILLNPPDKRQSDIDNRVKVLLDSAQKNGLIDNDFLCRLLIVSYGTKDTAPLGARLILNSM
jgi:Holliday junction resolvase RusA-like endonuclease